MMIKQAMLTSRQFRIITFMLQMQHAVSSTLIAQAVGCSARTVKQELLLLKQEASACGFSIIVKKGSGYLLHVDHEKTFQAFLDMHMQENNVQDKRCALLQAILLSASASIHLSELEDTMFCARNIILSTINDSSKRLKEYDLQLRSSNKGYAIIGKELHKRICIHNLIKQHAFSLQDTLQAYLPPRNLHEHMMHILIDCLNEEHEASLSKIAVDEIISYLYISQQRNKEAYPLSFSAQDFALQQEFPITYATSLKIIQRLQATCSVFYTKEDILFLLILIMSYRISNMQFAKEHLRKELHDIAEDCLCHIQEKMGIYIKEGREEVCSSIARYLRSFQLRNTYHIIMRIDYISYVKIRRSFLSALDMAYYCLEYLYNTYDYIINRDELLYLTPSFVSYHAQLKKTTHLSALIIISSGMMFGNLIMKRLRHDFPDTFAHLEIKEAYLVNADDLQKADIIFTDLAVEMLPLHDCSVCQISSLLEDPQDTVKILHFIASLGELSLLDIFGKDQLFFWHYTSKEEIFFHLADTIGNQYPRSDKTRILRELIRKEAIFSYECGNHAAVCFLYDDIYAKERMYIIILHAPLLWEKEIVQIVFVFCLKRNNDRPYLYLIKEISGLIQDISIILTLTNCKSYDALCHCIRQNTRYIL